MRTWTPWQTLATLAASAAAMTLLPPSGSAHPVQDRLAGQFASTVATSRRSSRELRTSSAARLASILRREAERLHSVPARWRDVAILHVQSAGLTAGPGRRHNDLRIAANVYYQTGEMGIVCTLLASGSMEHESVASLIRIARASRRMGCGDRWTDLLERLIIPAPAPIQVSPPQIPSRLRVAMAAAVSDPARGGMRRLGRLEPPSLIFPANGFRDAWGSDGVVDAPELRMRVAPPEIPDALRPEGEGVEIPVLEPPPLEPPPFERR
ncbi:MAG: hypothetical protein ACE5HF_04795 [Gemmatimonadota bacterium]